MPDPVPRLTDPVRFDREDLRPLAIFQGLQEGQLDWFCERGERRDLAVGQRMFERGQPSSAMWVVVEGVIHRFEEIGGQWLLVATTHAGEVTGMLPFSRMTQYPGHTVAAEPSRVLRLDAAHFRELIDVNYDFVARLVHEMSDRVRGDVRLEQQNEKLMALGRLSAGLAHELNNPAAAIRRAAAKLAEHRSALPRLVTALARSQLDDASLQRLVRVRERAASADVQYRSGASAADVEEELSAWLEARGVDAPWEKAATFADAGITVEVVEEATESVPPAALDVVLAWLSAGIESDRIVLEIQAATARISELVASIKVYSHMDRSREHKPIDVRVGLDNTVTMLGHKLKQSRIELEREYDEDVPLVPGNAGELNQVWTNLIDNAADAIPDGGTLTLRVRRNDIWVEVDVGDDGPGIPAEIRSRIFEPFFTTKEVGVGTGLGLGIARRIVRTHQGDIEVRSGPDGTVVCVRLPIRPATPVAT